MSTRFKASVLVDNDPELANRHRKCYELELHEAYKEVNLRSPAEVHAFSSLKDWTYHDEFPYRVGLLSADYESNLAIKYFSAFNS